MMENSDYTEDTLLKSYIKSIASAQSAVQELQREINQLRGDARADGFNMEAIHQLGQIVAKSPHDGGIGLLTDMFQYAHSHGVVVDTIHLKIESTVQTSVFDDDRGITDVQEPMGAGQVYRERLSLLTQFALGLVVTASLIWLLH